MPGCVRVHLQRPREGHDVLDVPGAEADDDRHLRGAPARSLSAQDGLEPGVGSADRVEQASRAPRQPRRWGTTARLRA